MSAQEPAVGFTDAGSSVKLVLNAKREMQTEIKIRVGDTEQDVAEASRIAQKTYDQIVAKYAGSGS